MLEDIICQKHVLKACSETPQSCSITMRSMFGWSAAHLCKAVDIYRCSH